MGTKVSSTPPRRWLEPSRDVWEAINGKGTFPWAMAGKYLKPLKDELGADGVAEHLKVYLKRTDARFLNLFRFAATYQQYDPAQLDLPLVDEFGMLNEDAVK
jgi:hypothetical protein